MTVIEQRLEQLERQTRRQRLALVVLTVALCGVVSMAATEKRDAEFDTIRAHAVYVENARGQLTVALEADSGGDGAVKTYSAMGGELVELSATADGKGMVATYSSLGRKLVELGATVSGVGTLTTHQPTGKKLVELGATVEGGGIFVFNKTGEGIVTLQADDYGNGQVGAWSRSGTGRMYGSE